MADILGKLCCFLSTLCFCGGGAVKHKEDTHGDPKSRKITPPAAPIAQEAGTKGWRRFFSSTPSSNSSSSSCDAPAAWRAAACCPDAAIPTHCRGNETSCQQQSVPPAASLPASLRIPSPPPPDENHAGCHEQPACSSTSSCSSSQTINSDSSCFSSSSCGSNGSSPASNAFISCQRQAPTVPGCEPQSSAVIAEVTAQCNAAAKAAPGADGSDSLSCTPSGSFSSSAVDIGCHCEKNARSHMEDRMLVLHLTACEPFASNGVGRASLVAVFDGHGGHQAAELLLSLLPQHLLQQPGLLSAPSAALEAAVLACEYALLSQLAAAGCDSTGSTLLAVLLVDNSLYTANVGDCRAVLGKGAEAVQITRDHKPSCSIEAARIAAADPEACITQDGYIYGELAVGRALGSPKLKRDASKRALVAAPELFTTQLASCHDFLLLASDGLWDGLSNREAVATVRRSLAADRNADAAAAALVKRAVQMGSGDNISVLVVLLHERPILLPKSNSRLFARRLPADSSSEGGSNSSSSINLMASSSSSVARLVCSGSQVSLAASGCSIAEEVAA